MLHETRDGTLIEISDMSDRHLRNTIAMMHRKAKEGLVVRCGGMTFDNDPWYDKDVLYGQDALDHMNTAEYEAEMRRREQKSQPTIPPYMTNCPHQPDGWCLGCVNAERNRWKDAIAIVRDDILNDRGPLEGENMTAEQTNAVLSIIDENLGGLWPKQHQPGG